MPHGSLEVDEDLRFQRRWWWVRRAGYVLVLAFLVAAVLGFTGIEGPFSQAAAGGGEGEVRVRYERTVAYLAPHELAVEIAPAMGGEHVRLAVDRGYLDAFLVEGVVPEPEAVEAAPGRLVYVFAREAAGTPLDVTFELRALNRGPREGAIGVVGTPPVRFTQIVVP